MCFYGYCRYFYVFLILFFYEITFRQKPRDPIRWQLCFFHSNPSSFLCMHHDHLFLFGLMFVRLHTTVVHRFFSNRIEITLLALRVCDFVVQSTNTQQNRPIKMHTKIMTIFGTFNEKNSLEICVCVCVCWVSIEFPLVCTCYKHTYTHTHTHKISIFRVLSIRGTFHYKEKIVSTLFTLLTHTHAHI